MLRKIIVAAAAATLLTGMVSVASSQVRHRSGVEHAPSYGYSAGDRGDPTNTNGY